ncbi:hypothetical protein RhiirA4_537325 [Rhizophagus irregularis]|uniref:Cytochrome P450 n=1 Tax=Rhizophagus irregularis TaxID=588596 RepID=A0A2I1FVX9_9GLOM|nr:hypothetical protein RhiirA4_537325 [Rhizophagus irregularis]
MNFIVIILFKISSCLLSNRKEIVKEVARVFSTVTSSARYIDKPTIHNDDYYWEEPYNFNPDGWMDENFEPKKNSFIMFNEGLRLCPGRKSWIFNRHFLNRAILLSKFTDEAIDWTNKLFDELEGYWNELFLKEVIIKENKNILVFLDDLVITQMIMMIKLLTGERSYLMAAYFDIFSDEKSDYQSAIINDSVKLFQPLRKQLLADDMLHDMGFINQKLDAIIKSCRKEIEVDEPLPHDMLTSMIIKNTFRDDNYIETGKYLNAYKRAFLFYIAHYLNVKKKMSEEIDNIFQGKILAPLNGASEEKIGEALNNQQNLCSKNPNEPENSPAKYYQLTVSDEMEEILNNTEIKYNLFIRNPIADDVNHMIFPIQEAGGIRSNYYAVNIITGESCLDYTWNGSFRDVCKHVHAVLTYFKDKQRVLPSPNKNLLIYNGSVDIAYQEIIRLYNLQGNLIFNSNERPTNHINEPFRPNDQILVH